MDSTNVSLHHNLQKYSAQGSTLIRHVFTKKEVNAMKLKIKQHLHDTGLPENTHALRNLFGAVQELKAIVLNANQHDILKRIDPALFLAKSIYFDKTPEANWYVTWHQDIVINVEDRIDTEGFAGWTKKENHVGVVPTDEILKSIVTVRIHLNDVDETNGVLKIVQGSHNKKLSDAEISHVVQNSMPVTCDGESGTIHLMKPLLLHASSKATKENRHRRVVHLEFNSVELPNGS